MSELEEWMAATAPFHTFEACDATKLELIMTMLADAKTVPSTSPMTTPSSGTTQGDMKDSSSTFKAMMENDEIVARLESQGVTSPENRGEIDWDDATLAWICSLPGDGGLPEPLGNDKSRERMGRFPWGDGNPLSYLLEFITPFDDGEELLALVSELALRFSSEKIGHDNYRNGAGGMCMLGYLSADEARELQQLLSRGKWAVSSDEVFDGGVREIAKYLVIVLRQAFSRGNGVLLRAHS
ncbi:MAG: hypothetical protein CXX80_05675 [Methanobacteriota archaeon]|nr:MAG: hypothetical protein CXX80_10255 [Euryarchaeota archaeon]PXY75024.1 MAG: hypothetical protein CXX80_05675 [Euryarchaeota archaeon]HIA90467.1 hypothetical protein [Candidatus Poseidoniales archaeon]HIB59034.1 hypothetical protein [Candidatus Poseidoniales archaeon]